MRPLRALVQVRVRVMIEAEEAVADLMERVMGVPPVLYTREATLRTDVSAYLTRPGQWTPRRQVALAKGLARLRRAGLPLGLARISVRSLPPRDWAESWKNHFHVLLIGRKLLVRPTWSRRRPGRGQAVITLDPGLSFGTGQHPTTLFCLEQVVRWRPRTAPRSFLDLGTGSGILALAAARLGYAPVVGVDHDPAAVCAAEANAAQNDLAGSVCFRRADVRRLRGRLQRPHDLVAANLLDDLLVGEAGRIRGLVKPGGRLVVAGILDAQFLRVQTAFETLGLRLRRSVLGKGWRSGLFEAG